MNKLKPLIITAISAYGMCLTSSALATTKNASAAPGSGFSVGASLGYGQIESPTSRAKRDGAGLRGSLQGERAWGVNVDYIYPSNKSYAFGAQLGYNDYGKSSVTYNSRNEYDFTEQSINLLAVSQIKLMAFTLQAKAGVAFASEAYRNVRRVSDAPDVASRKNKIKPLASIGLGYQVNNRIQFQVTYSHLFGDKQKYISEAFGTLVPTDDRLATVASVNTVMFGINMPLS